MDPQGTLCQIRGRDKWPVYQRSVLAKKGIEIVEIEGLANMLVRELGESVHVEELKLKISGRRKAFDTAWGPVADYCTDRRV